MLSWREPVLRQLRIGLEIGLPTATPGPEGRTHFELGLRVLQALEPRL